MKIPTSVPNCLLRPWQPTDQSNLVINVNNRKIWRNLTGMFPHPYTPEDATFWIQFVNGPGRSLHLAIEFEGRAIGGIGVIAGDDIDLQTGRFGYWIGEAYWGKGIGTAVVRALIKYLEGDRRFARLEAAVFG